MVSHPTIDFGLRSDDYASHRPGPPASFYGRLERFVPLDGTRVLDLGTGPGTVALELASRGADVVGIDVSASQIAAARKVAAARTLAGRVRFEVAPAEDTGLEARSVQLVTAGQCWVWFDNAKALTEVERVLVSGGLLAVVHYCYLPRHSEIAAASEALILKYNPGWRFAGFDGAYPWQIDGLQTESLKLVEQLCYDYQQSFSHEDWRGRMRTCNGVGAGGMTEEDVERYDSDLATLLARDFPNDPVQIAHRLWAVICRKAA